MWNKQNLYEHIFKNSDLKYKLILYHFKVWHYDLTYIQELLGKNRILNVKVLTKYKWKHYNNIFMV